MTLAETMDRDYEPHYHAVVRRMPELGQRPCVLCGKPTTGICICAAAICLECKEERR